MANNITAWGNESGGSLTYLSGMHAHHKKVVKGWIFGPVASLSF